MDHAVPPADGPGSSLAPDRSRRLFHVSTSARRPPASGNSGCCSATAAISEWSAPVVGGDLGFHLFSLPFLSAATSFLRQLLLFTLGLAAFGHVMSGALRMPKNAPASSRVASAHLAMLVAGFLAVQAFHDVVVARPAMATDRVGAFDGPGWTVAKRARCRASSSAHSSRSLLHSLRSGASGPASGGLMFVALGLAGS